MGPPPASARALVPREEGVCLGERPAEERRGGGQRRLLWAVLFCMVAAVFFALPLCLLWADRLCRAVMGGL